MGYQHQRFHTNGSNALKAEELEFDIFVKPQFFSEQDHASIIDFDTARQEHRCLTKSESAVEESYSTQAHPKTPVRLGAHLASALKNNKILGDLFVSSKKNCYRREDLIIFSKGFSVTGLVAFIMILFGAQ